MSVFFFAELFMMSFHFLDVYTRDLVDNGVHKQIRVKYALKEKSF